MKYQQMRIFCMFDLPMETKKQQREYRMFRKGLIENGFNMLQFSVYYRTVPNREAAKKFVPRLTRMAPSNGEVRVLYVSEKQFSDMELIVGNKGKQEEVVGARKLVII